MLAWVRKRLGRRREVDILEAFEFAWRMAIVVSVVALPLTFWIWLWGKMT